MRGTIWGLLASCFLLPASAPFAATTPYDLVILHGRVMDPETGADRIANVGAALRGRAEGLVRCARLAALRKNGRTR